MKKLFLLPAMLMAFTMVMAQNIETQSVQVGTVTAPGFSVTIQKKTDLVENAMTKRLKDAGLKTKKSEGFVAALDQLFAEIATDPINLYTKVEKESKNSARVTACVIPTDLTADRETMQANLRRFVEGFVQYVNKYEAQNNMEAEQDNLKKAEKSQAKAVAAVEKLDKNIQKNKEKIADKKKDIENYNQKIKDCQEDIKKLEAEIAKDQQKKTEAQKDVEKANDNVKSVQGEVEKYRQQAE
ncbi:MAG: hypothetical protein IJ634_06330 [Bacteroidales bacterium]|nr:hypothetical protein [Bacteroidales bacterium]